MSAKPYRAVEPDDRGAEVGGHRPPGRGVVENKHSTVVILLLLFLLLRASV
jgi:hypothetical protein